MLGLDQEPFDDLFDRAYKPFRSRNARNLFNIFLMEKEAEYLTTLDIQTHLDRKGIGLSKKEINAWLRSLQEADLIAKQLERGKPTTLAYSDKYTFDKWNLTPIGLRVSEELRSLIYDNSNGGQHPGALQDHGQLDIESMPQQQTLQTRNLQMLLLTELHRSEGRMKRKDLMHKAIPAQVQLDHALSALIDQGMVEVKQHEEGGFIARVLVGLGLMQEDQMVYLTEKENQVQ